MLGAAPHRGDCVAFRRLGNCLLGVANRPDFVDCALSAEGGIIAALSGRLDNAAELHQELTDAGTPPVSTAGADIVVAAHRAFGLSAPNHMRGAFAGIVTDGDKLWCFRDHVGFRPLFYRDEPRAFFAASEARQVVAGAQISEAPDFDAIEAMFFGRLDSDGPAALKGVSRLAQGTTLQASPVNGISIHRYWHPTSLLETSSLKPDDARERFLQLLGQAAARSLTGNDAILLSGGLDSPAVAAFAAPEYRRRTGQPMGALSLVFPHLPSVDERPLIELVAERFGMELHTYQPTARALDDVDEWCRRFGSPVPVLSIPEVADAYVRARKLGYQNLLTGEWAEFVFGSPSHLLPHLLTHGRLMPLARLMV